MTVERLSPSIFLWLLKQLGFHVMIITSLLLTSLAFLSWCPTCPSRYYLSSSPNKPTISCLHRSSWIVTSFTLTPWPQISNSIFLNNLTMSPWCIYFLPLLGTISHVTTSLSSISFTLSPYHWQLMTFSHIKGQKYKQSHDSSLNFLSRDKATWLYLSLCFLLTSCKVCEVTLLLSKTGPAFHLLPSSRGLHFYSYPPPISSNQFVPLYWIISYGLWTLKQPPNRRKEGREGAREGRKVGGREGGSTSFDSKIPFQLLIHTGPPLDSKTFWKSCL